MDEFDLRDKIPDSARTMDLIVITDPPLSYIEIRRSPTDAAPLRMSAGMSTTMGIPEGRKLYIYKIPGVREYQIKIAGWDD